MSILTYPFYYIMENDLFNFGQVKLNKNALLQNIQANLDSYLSHKGMFDAEELEFRNALAYIQEGIDKGTITTNGLGKYVDSESKLDDSYSKALWYVNTIASKQALLTKEKTKPEIEDAPKSELEDKPQFDLEKNTFGKFFDDKYNVWGIPNYGYTEWKSKFNDQQSLNNALIQELQNYIDNLDNYTFSEKFNIAKYRKSLANLISDIQTDGIQDSDLQKFQLLGINPNAILLSNSEESKNENLVNQEELINENPTNQENSLIGKLWDRMSPHEKTRLALIIPDVLSAISAQIPGWGTLGSAVTGIGGTTANLVNDLLDDENYTNWQALGNFGVNLGLDVVGLVPGLGISGKVSKIGKMIRPSIKWLNYLLATSGFGHAADVALKVVSNPDEVSAQDLEALARGLSMLATGAVSYGLNKNIKKETLEFRNIPTKSGKKVEVSEETYERLKNLPETEQSAEFKRIFKEELAEPLNTKEKFWSGYYNYNKSIKPTQDNRNNSVYNFNFSKLRQKPNAEVNKPSIPSDTKAAEKLNHLDETLQKTFRNKNTPLSSKDIKLINADRKRRGLDPLSEKEIQFLNDRIKARTKTEVKQTLKEKLLDKQREQANKEALEKEIKEAQEEYKEAERRSKLAVPVNENIQPVQKNKQEGKTIREQAKFIRQVSNLIQSNTTPKISPKGIKSLVHRFSTSDLNGVISRLPSKNKKRIKPILKRMLQDQELANMVKQDNSLASAEFNQVVQNLKKSGMKESEIVKMLTDLGYYKEGGKVQFLQTGGNSVYYTYLKPNEDNIKGTGINDPYKWYKALYKQQSLTGWNNTLDKTNSSKTGIDNASHYKASNLDEAARLNDLYIKSDRVGSDLQQAWQYLNSPSSMNDFVTEYNLLAGTIRNNWGQNHTYNTRGFSNFNSLYNELFKSRGNINDIGYSENLNDIMGSSTWLRRMDRYQTEWEDAPLTEKLQRTHPIKDVQGNVLFYVYKKANGDIGAMDNTYYNALLNGAPKEGTIITPGIQQVDPINQQNNQQSSEVTLKHKKIDPTGDSLKKRTIWDPSRLIPAITYFNTLRHNEQQQKLQDKMPVLLYDPIEYNKYVQGDLDSLNAGIQSGSQLTTYMAKPKVSDSGVTQAGMLQAFDKAREYAEQGRAQDNAARKQSYEEVWEQGKENSENRYNIAMKNRENVNQSIKENLLSKMAKLRSDYDSTTNFARDIQGYAQEDFNRKQAEDSFMYKRSLQRDIVENPQNYFQDWNTYYQDIWERGQSGNLTSQEQSVYDNLKAQMMDLFYNNYYKQYTPIQASRIRSAMNWLISSKNGGTINKMYVQYLKESNKNYNKAIDRSVKGLYNHLKLQRKK